MCFYPCFNLTLGENSRRDLCSEHLIPYIEWCKERLGQDIDVFEVLMNLAFAQKNTCYLFVGILYRQLVFLRVFAPHISMPLETSYCLRWTTEFCRFSKCRFLKNTKKIRLSGSCAWNLLNELDCAIYDQKLRHGVTKEARLPEIPCKVQYRILIIFFPAYRIYR